jgi:4-hydroxy-tetrahydrodipicolinate synthase
MVAAAEAGGMTFSGVFVPLVTPFDADGAVDLAALRGLARDVLAAGASGLVALGTTGEPSALSPGERRAVVEAVASVCGEHEVPLVVGAGPLEQASAALSVVPPFVRPGEAGVIAHFAALAAASPIPLIVYHVPYRTAQPLSVRAIRELAGIDGVAGIKLATGGIDAGTVELMADPPPGFAVLGGDDAVISPLLALGAAGGVLASAHFATGRFVELVAAWRDGDASRARALGHRLAALSIAVFAEPNPAVVKAVLHAQGRIATPAVRLPLLSAAPESVRAAAALA